MRVAMAVLLGLFVQGGSARMVRNTAYARVEVARAIAADPTIRASVQRKNAEGETPDAVARIDASWVAGGEAELKAELVGSRCAERLREQIAADALIVEAIVMDRHGALVCASGPTSDYDQSDEPKWQRTVSEGRAVFIDEPAYDESSGTYAIQLSVPVLGDGGPMGALTLTLRLAAGNGQP